MLGWSIYRQIENEFFKVTLQWNEKKLIKESFKLASQVCYHRVKEKLINTKKFTFNLPTFQILEETCTVDTVVGSSMCMYARSMTENGLDIYFFVYRRCPRCILYLPYWMNFSFEHIVLVSVCKARIYYINCQEMFSHFKPRGRVFAKGGVMSRSKSILT